MQNTPPFLSASELTRFIGQRVLVKPDSTDHDPRQAVLVAVDTVDRTIRVKYNDTGEVEELTPDRISLLLRPQSAMTALEAQKIPHHSDNYPEMAWIIDYLDNIGIDCRNYLEKGRAVEVDSFFEELESRISSLLLQHRKAFLYRGQANAGWDTHSKLARTYPELPVDQLASEEQRIITDLQAEYHRHLFEPTSSENRKQWYLLMQAQHLGKPTRFLDWTTDWKRALFFLLEDRTQDDQDGALLFTDITRQQCHDEQLDQIDPYNLDEVKMIFPVSFVSDDFKTQLGSKRIYRQIGKFLVVPLSKCQRPLEEVYAGYFDKIIIPREQKGQLRNELLRRGITSETLYFPQIGN